MLFYFLPRDAILAQYILSSCVRLTVRHKPVLYRIRLDESSWFLAWRLSYTYPTLCCKDIWTLSKKLRYSSRRKFRHGKLIALSTELGVVVVDGRAC